MIPGLVTADEAREILGDIAERMTDDQISELISQLQLMAENYLDQYKKSLTNVRLSTKLN